MKLVKKLFLVTMVCFAVMACSKDDDGGDNDTVGGTSSENKFTFDGETYNLKGGLLEYYGESNDGVYNFDVSLMTTTFSSSGVPADNIFNAIYFELFTDNPNNLKVGAYTPGNVANPSAGTIGYADIELGVSLQGEGGTYYEITSSTFKVIANGTYEFEFSGTANEKSFSGYYKGSLLKLDFGE